MFLTKNLTEHSFRILIMKTDAVYTLVEYLLNNSFMGELIE